MIDFTGVTALRVPEGNVVKVTNAAGEVLWEKRAADDFRNLYQRIEYLYTPGGSTSGYFLTDFMADNDSGVEIVASYPTRVDAVPMGSRNTSGDTRFFATYMYSTSNRFYTGFNKSVAISFTNKLDTIYRSQTNFKNSRYARVYDAEGTQIASSAKLATLTAQTCEVAILCYKRASDGYISGRRPLYFYEAKLSQGTEVVRHYLPCYRKADGVIGLWEVYTGTFMQSAKEDAVAFTAGHDIAWEV